MCKHIVKKLPFLFRYVPDQCKTQQMCDKDKNQGICNKAVDNYTHAL